MRLKKVFKNIIIGILCFSIAFFSGATVTDWYLRGHNPGVANGEEQQIDDQPGRINVLLLGMDARPGEEKARTDTIILASIDRDTKKVALVSIPRDSRVQLPGHGWDKINSAYLYGGAAMTQKVVGDLLGISVPYYMVTNFNGFQGIVDTLGGVEIDVDKRMYYPDEDIDLQPGLQRLDGHDALSYVRYRYDALGDITRTERQQRFLTALAKEAAQMKTVTKLPKLIPQLRENVDTNLGLSDMLFLAQVAAGIDPANIATQTLPGDFLDIDEASYWEPDRVKSKTVIAQLFEQAGVVQHVPTEPTGANAPPSSKTSTSPTATKPTTSSGQKTTTSPNTQTGTGQTSGGTTAKPSENKTDTNSGTTANGKNNNTTNSKDTTSSGSGTTVPSGSR